MGIHRKEIDISKVHHIKHVGLEIISKIYFTINLNINFCKPLFKK